MPKRLLLWDIDATLITSGGAGEKALKRIIAERFGVRDDLRDIEIAGRTDTGIAASILRKYQIEPTAENVAEFLDEYIHHLAKLLPEISGRVLPGVAEVLERLHQNPDRVLALLTGNVRRGAELKLRQSRTVGLLRVWRLRGRSPRSQRTRRLRPREGEGETFAGFRGRADRRHRRYRSRHCLWQNLRRADDRRRHRVVDSRATGRARSRFPLRRSLAGGRGDRHPRVVRD